MKGGGDVGGEYPRERIFGFLVRMFRVRVRVRVTQLYPPARAVEL